MSNHVNFPYVLPFRFVPNTSTPGIHFYDSWSVEQIRSWQKKVCYYQKWNKGDTTPLQIESSIAPQPLAIYDFNGNVAKTINWTAVLVASGYSLYECIFDISDLPDGKYIPFIRVNLLGIDWKAIAEPIHSKESWPNTELIEYWNTFNKDDVGWTTGIRMKFRAEVAVLDAEFNSEIAFYVNQNRSTSALDGTAYNTYKLYVAGMDTDKGVAPYIVDILNRIFVCDRVFIRGKQFAREGPAKFEISRYKAYPLVTASLEITDAVNSDSLQFSETTPLAPGIVVAYNMQTAFFGPGALVPVADMEEQG